MCEMLVSLLKKTVIVQPLLRKKFDPSICMKNVRSISQKPLQIVPHDATIEKYNTDGKSMRRGARYRLQTLLGIKGIDAIKLLSSHQKINGTPMSLIAKNYKICMEHKLDKDVIVNYPFLLCENNLAEKITRLQKLPIDLPCSIPLARLSLRKLYSVLLNANESMEKIHDLCHIFDIPLEDACDILSKKQFLFIKPLSELKEMLNFLHDYNITKEEILKDLWVFKYSKKFVRNRLDFVKDTGIHNLKTWMIRCPEETLFKHIKRETDNRDILGENSVAQYLSEKLKCSEAVAKNLIRKHPQLQNKSLLKMNVMIELLYRQGFTPTQICRVPKILLHSTKTTEQRLKQLTTLGKKPNTLYILTKSQKQYMQHIDNLVKTKGKVEDDAVVNENII